MNDMVEFLQSINARPVNGPASGGEGNKKEQGKVREASAGGLQGDVLNLSPEAQAQLRKLKQRDAEVRAHENAHMAAAGGNAVGGPHYEYQQGPDGRQYAIGGHVDISLSSAEGDPEENEENAKAARRAALAPGQPSGQDRAVAARAASMETKARAEQVEEDREENAENDPASISAEAKDASVSPKNLEGKNGAESFSESLARFGGGIMARASRIYNEAAQNGMLNLSPSQAPALSIMV